VTGPPVRSVDAVVIGGSAGSVEALPTVLDGLPASCPFAVVLVVHLPARLPSFLPQVLAARCRLPVREAQDKEPVAPAVVWCAPPGYHLYVEAERTFALSLDEPVRFSRPSIDVLFGSAADAYGTRVAGVVLTGANEDGAEGLAAIARAGGIAVVQDPSTALVATMPAAARAAARADALPLRGLRDYLARLAHAST
jgi:two-component system, chemotaxis family, protein-glutamate methylesterase/glutaminase